MNEEHMKVEKSELQTKILELNNLESEIKTSQESLTDRVTAAEDDRISELEDEICNNFIQ